MRFNRIHCESYGGTLVIQGEGNADNRRCRNNKPGVGGLGIPALITKDSKLFVVAPAPSPSDRLR
jgi:hypothetical protein